MVYVHQYSKTNQLVPQMAIHKFTVKEQPKRKSYPKVYSIFTTTEPSAIRSELGHFKSWACKLKEETTSEEIKFSEAPLRSIKALRGTSWMLTGIQTKETNEFTSYIHCWGCAGKYEKDGLLWEFRNAQHRQGVAKDLCPGNLARLVIQDNWENTCAELRGAEDSGTTGTAQRPELLDSLTVALNLIDWLRNARYCKSSCSSSVDAGQTVWGAIWNFETAKVVVRQTVELDKKVEVLIIWTPKRTKRIRLPKIRLRLTLPVSEIILRRVSWEIQERTRVISKIRISNSLDITRYIWSILM